MGTTTTKRKSKALRGVDLSPLERSSMRTLSGLSEVTLRYLYAPVHGRTTREASWRRAVAAATALGLPHPPLPVGVVGVAADAQ